VSHRLSFKLTVEPASSWPLCILRVLRDPKGDTNGTTETQRTLRQVETIATDTQINYRYCVFILTNGISSR